MPVGLLTVTVVVEPDLQRMAALILDAATALGGNIFEVTSRLNRLLAHLRKDGLAAGRFLQVTLMWEGERLVIDWGVSSMVLCAIAHVPPKIDLKVLSEQLTATSESASPALLMQRYAEIRRQLEDSRAKAAQEVADLGLVLERKKQDLKTMLHKAETDALTGLLNRRAYEERLEAVVPSGGIVSLVFFDLDHFKEVNDREGHQAGDVYLRHMADVLSRSIRGGEDLAFRIGGDEFAVLVFADEAVGARLGQAVLKEMGHVSVGVAERLPGESVAAWAARADAALYAAKHAGRGRVRLASDDVPSHKATS
ncbi:MAG: GGDEF domain-containing protein [Acidiferrobacteraceae bacterium]